MDKITTIFIADSAEEFCTQLSNTLQQAEGFHILGVAGPVSTHIFWRSMQSF